MGNPSNWTATGYDAIAVGGVRFPTQRQVLNFPAGTVVSDDPTGEMTNIIPSGGGGSAPWTQDCSTGGTIAYSGPMPPPATIVLTGTPAGTFDYTLPNGPYSVAIGNETGQIARVYSWPIPLDATWSFSVWANGYVFPSFAPSAQQDVVCGPMGGLVVSRIQGYEASLVPILGVGLNPKDASTWGITPPVAGAGPINGLADVALWQTTRPSYGFPGLSWGWQGADQSGAANVLVEPAVYPNVAWASQPQTTLGGKFGDEIVGPSGSTAFDFALPVGMTHATIKVQACVVATSGSSEAVGDVFSFVSDMAWTSTGTAVAIVSPVRVQSTVLASTSMAATAVSCGAAGINAQVVVGAPATLDPSTVVDVQIRVYNADVGPWTPPTS
jgi:hypothetical protein